MNKELRTNLQIRADNLKRLAMLYFMAEKLNLVIISEFPKSGGSWFCQMLSDALKIPFPRNKSAQFKESIIHCHYLFNPRFQKMIGIIRDGRDVMVSAYFHFLIGSEIHPSFVVPKYRAQLQFDDYEDIRKNLPRFIEFMFETYNKKPFHFNWSQFINHHYNKPNIHIIKYEDLLLNASLQLKNAITFLERKEKSINVLKEIENNYSFRKLTKRKPGEEGKKKFLRKGIAGDWKNKFSKEACEVFDYYGGKELIIAGYETNHNWY